MAKIYIAASTDFFTRNKQTGLEMAGSILEFIGSNTPSPFNVAFTVLGKILEKVGYELETRHFAKIATVLPLEGQITELAENVTVSAIEYFSGYFTRKSIPLNKFTEKEMKEIAKRIFTVAVYTLYQVDDLGIKNPLTIPNKTRANMIKDKMLEAVVSSDYVSQALSSMERAASQRILTERTDVPTVVVFSSPQSSVMATQPLNGREIEEAQSKKPVPKKQGVGCILM